jgi:hypothetical protein
MIERCHRCREQQISGRVEADYLGQDCRTGFFQSGAMKGQSGQAFASPGIAAYCCAFGRGRSCVNGLRQICAPNRRNRRAAFMCEKWSVYFRDQSISAGPRGASPLRIRQHAALEIRDRCEERTNLADESRGDARGAEEGPPGIREACVHGEELGASKVDDNLVLHPNSIRPYAGGTEILRERPMPLDSQCSQAAGVATPENECPPPAKASPVIVQRMASPAGRRRRGRSQTAPRRRSGRPAPGSALAA